MSPRTPDRVDPEPTPVQPRSYRRLAIGSIAALVVAALTITAFVLLNGGGSATGPKTSPTPSVDPVATYLVQPADLDSVRPDTAWDAVATVTKPDGTTPAPRCLAPSTEATTQASSTLVRTFSPSAGAAAGILHQVETFATPEEATTAYAERATQLASCERNTAWATSGSSFEKLADEAVAMTLVLQGTEPEHHTIIVSRTGSRVNVIDATQAQQAMPVDSLLAALTTTLTRQCSDGGTCPESPTVTSAVPPSTEPAGYLAGVDLPRITAGVGAWRGTPPLATVSAGGSRCEAIDLTAPQGSTAQQQRVILLQDDTAAPLAFGVDELVYTFATPEEATAIVGTLGTNIDGCAARTGTAEVARTGEITGAGTGATWVVTRKLNQASATQRFRLAAMTVGNRVVYLASNPTAEFDFSDDAWNGVALRAAERLTQLP